jgi:hypothetical protein
MFLRFYDMTAQRLLTTFDQNQPGDFWSCPTAAAKERIEITGLTEIKAAAGVMATI